MDLGWFRLNDNLTPTKSICNKETNHNSNVKR